MKYLYEFDDLLMDVTHWLAGVFARELTRLHVKIMMAYVCISLYFVLFCFLSFSFERDFEQHDEFSITVTLNVTLLVLTLAVAYYLVKKVQKVSRVARSIKHFGAALKLSEDFLKKAAHTRIIAGGVWLVGLGLLSVLVHVQWIELINAVIASIGMSAMVGVFYISSSIGMEVAGHTGGK